MHTETNLDTQPRCGFVALVGPTNVGKSSLINKIVGAKVAIVSPKVQSTRTRLMGIACYHQTQCVFIDTPGFFQATKEFERWMINEIWNGIHQADLVITMIDAAKGINTPVRQMIKRLQEHKVQSILVINKIDLVPPSQLLPLVEEMHQTSCFSDIWMISVLKNDGIDDMMRYLSSHLPERPWIYPEDQVMDFPVRQWAAEITREKAFLLLRQELPYAIHVETESWQEQDERIVVHQVVYVERDSQKGMIIGKSGQMLKKIGQESRLELQRQLDRKIHLQLFVKVEPEWRRLLYQRPI